VRYVVRKGLLRKKTEIIAADRVSLSIAPGETLGLVGGTGSGKSTIAQVIAGLVESSSGSVTIGGHHVAQRDARERRAALALVQIVLQDPYSSLDPRMRVGEIVAEPLTLGNPFAGRARQQAAAERVKQLLRLVRLPIARSNSYPHQFSGGQRQRIAIARALAPEPKLIVLDEATSALDVSVRAQILTLLRGLQRDLGVAYLVISHDLISVAYLAKSVAVMHLGRVVEHGPTRTLFKSPRHPYTFELLASAPGKDGKFMALPPSPDSLPGSLPKHACKYAYRCTLRKFLGNPDKCVEADPDLVKVAPDHAAACHFSDRLPELVSSPPTP
jgi:oligopeptide/dipeptide ABC transporter ATP-binding protein